MPEAGYLLLLILAKFTIAGAMFMPLVSFGLFLARGLGVDSLAYEV